MSKLDNNLQYTYHTPLYHHIEVVEQEKKRILFTARNILGWQELEKVLADWRKSQETNEVDIWIATTENRIDLTSTKM